MLFSIVIPTYNRAAILQETLAAVLSQTCTDFEVLVVDDGSTDHTQEAVAGFRDERISYYYKANEERSIARNYGAERAKGDYLIFLDSDDRMERTHLHALSQFLEQERHIPDFIFSGYKILDPDDHSTVYSYGLEGFFSAKKLVYGNYLGCSAVTIRREVFSAHRFNTDPNLILFEDWELWLRVIDSHRLHCIASKSIIMVNHRGRSVLNYQAEQLDKKISHFRSHILHSENVISHSFINQRIFLNGIYSYAALHIALTGRDKGIALRYYLRCLFNNPFFLFRRRSFAIIKHLL